MLTQLQLGQAQLPDYYGGVLSKYHLPAFIALQQEIKPTLAKPHHLKARTLEDMERHIDHGGVVYGVFDKNHKMVGATILTDTDPSNIYTQNLEGYPKVEGAKEVIAIQSFCIHPDHKGKGIAKMMDAAMREIYPDAVFQAKVDITNTCSMESFAKRGFAETERATSIVRETGTPYLAAFFEKRPQPAPALQLLQGGMPNGGTESKFSL